MIKNLVNSNNQLSIIRGEEIIYINFKVDQEPYIFGIKLNNKNIANNLGFLNSFIGSISFLYKTIKLQIKTLTNLSLKNIEENQVQFILWHLMKLPMEFFNFLHSFLF